MTALTRWRALGTTAELVVTDPGRLFAARVAVERELAAIDRHCSRFRTDSHLARLNAAAGTGATRVPPLLLAAVQTALDAADETDGAVDPTVGAGMIAAGYDRDLAAVAADGPAFVPRAAPGAGAVAVDRQAGTVTLRAGTLLDLGATAKALAADRAATAAAAAAPGVGVLVSLGGDVAVAGPAPADGWPVGVADVHRASVPAQVVAVRAGGLATSGLAARAWRRGGLPVHHVLDPRDGRPVASVWRTVTVTAPSCVAANTRSTAALVWGHDAPERLAAAGLAARLVQPDGRVVRVGGWPEQADELWAA